MDETGAIYSPNIVVFRDSEFEGYSFKLEPELISIISCAAPSHPRLVTLKIFFIYTLIKFEKKAK